MPNPSQKKGDILWSSCAAGIEFQTLVCFTQITEYQESNLKTNASAFQDQSLELLRFCVRMKTEKQGVERNV